MNINYMIYGKAKTARRFRPFNMKDSVFVINLIHASLYEGKCLKRLTSEVERLNSINPDFIFEVRKVK